MYSFIFADHSRTLAARGVEVAFTTLAEAEGFLQQPGKLLVGAIPFHRRDPAYLFQPDSWEFGEKLPQLETWLDAQVIGVEDHPSPQEHQRAVAQAVETIKQGSLKKIVLSRAQRYQLAAPVSAEAILAKYMATAGTGYGYLTAVGGGAYFVGPSPEVLIRKQGRWIESFPLAGTAPRSHDPEIDNARAQALLTSTKDHVEHAYVTEGIAEVLGPLCTHLEVPPQPELMHTAHTWHLGTKIVGQLAEDISALSLAHMLHPTAAVNGHPAPQAREMLARQEPNRNFYSGVVGWADSQGNGEWRVSIRSALVEPEAITAYAGGGIVADSVPAEELAETSAKLGPIRAVLGLEPEKLTLNTDVD
ncbi:isochorismate mutase [Corynebacterium phocae]|uniref:isochorismate synthase n=1 Tax=Corynebacterium phocae TaxID=161895 RepID=A0A1L7D5T4_9CORY|nr:isochorismate synthase [Corynebacterium phocae]APT93353.1 isochorismate mutase [Corynebacterium phocae]KAA8721690.1 isochorismate synthase [Corynebacterium phocae]